MAINNSNPANPRRTGSGFTNLQRIMQANTGNKLGQAVGGGIQQAGQQARQKLGQAEEEFNVGAASGRLDQPEARQQVERVLGDPGQASEGDIKDFSKYRAGQYTGPRGLQDSEAIKGQAGEAEQLGRSVGTTGGRQALLQRFAAGPGQYQAGQQKLDTLLLGATGGKQLKDARRSVAGLGQEATRGEQTAGEVARGYESQAKGFGEEVTQRTGALEGQALSSAQQRAQQSNEADAALREQAEAQRQKASQNVLSQQALEALGLQAGQRTYGTNLGEFIGYQGRDALGQAKAEEVMSQDEFKRFSNLRQLMGGNTEGFDPTKVGSYQAGKIDFNKDAAAQALQAGEAKLAPERGAVAGMQEITNLASGQLTPEQRAEGASMFASENSYGLAQQTGINYDQAVKEATGKQPAFGSSWGFMGPQLTPQEEAKVKEYILNRPESGQLIGQQILKVKHPGAVSGGGTRLDWAQNELAKAQQRLAERDRQLAGNVSVE